MDSTRIWTERNKSVEFSLAWRLQEISKVIGKRTTGFFVFGVLFLSLLFSTEIVHAEDGRFPKEPPTILSHTPEADATQVPVNGVISVTWDRPMQPDTSFTITGPEGFVTGAFLYDPKTYTVTFFPEENLWPDTRYGVLVAGQVDMGGLVQQLPYQWNFNTVTPTAVSIVSFGQSGPNTQQSWWWSSWPWLMVIISIVSLIGFLGTWGRRRLTSLSENIFH